MKPFQIETLWELYQADKAKGCKLGWSGWLDAAASHKPVRTLMSRAVAFAFMDARMYGR